MDEAEDFPVGMAHRRERIWKLSETIIPEKFPALLPQAKESATYNLAAAAK